MRNILVAVAGLVVLLGLWRLGLLWLGPSAGTGGHDSADHDLESQQVTSSKTNPEEFKSKFKEIHLDMSELEVDQILAGYPCERRDLTEYEKEQPPNPYGFDWKLKRKSSFVKRFVCKPLANEASSYIDVYFDDNRTVVNGLLLGNEFLSKCSEIQLDMTEEQVDEILKGHPCQRRELAEFERKQAGFAGPLKRKGSFVKTYDSVLNATEGHLYIDVYFDDNYTVVGKYVGEYIS